MEIHPLIVHFPIVCLILAAIFDWVGRIPSYSDATRTGFILLLIGAVSTTPAAYTGEAAGEIAQSIPGIQNDLSDHQDASTFTLWSAILLGIARIHLVVRKQYAGGRRLAHTIVLTVCAGLVIWSAFTGGRLVQTHGAGTVGAQTSPTQN